MQTTITMRVLTNEGQDRANINAVIGASDDYSILITGASHQLGDADSTFTDGPPNWRADDKFVVGFFHGASMVGFADIYRGWNAPHKAHIGFLIFPPAQRGKGYGSSALALITALAKSWPDITTLRIGVIGNNRVGLDFWHKMGFTETGDVKKDVAPYLADIVVFEKLIGD